MFVIGWRKDEKAAAAAAVEDVVRSTYYMCVVLCIKSICPPQSRSRPTAAASPAAFLVIDLFVAQRRTRVEEIKYIHVVEGSNLALFPEGLQIDVLFFHQGMLKYFHVKQMYQYLTPPHGSRIYDIRIYCTYMKYFLHFACRSRRRRHLGRIK